MATAARSEQSDLEKLLVIGVKLGIFLVLFMPLIVTTDTLFPFIVGKALYARGIIQIVFGMWLILAVKFPAYRPSRGH